MSVTQLPDNGSHLCTVAIYRRGDGSIKAILAALPGHVIDAEPDTAALLEKAAVWTRRAAYDLLQQIEAIRPTTEPNGSETK